MNKAEKNYFILMADVKDSRRENTDIISPLKGLVTAINRKFKKEILSPLTITLGDEFQGIMKDLQTSLAAIIELEELIIKDEINYKLRYVLNYGPIDTKINPENAHEMFGEGLTKAREALDKSKKTGSRFTLYFPNNETELILNDLFFILQNYIDNWDKTDYKYLKAYWDKNSYRGLIDSTGYTKSGAWKKAKALEIGNYSIIKTVIWNLGKTLDVS